MATTRRKTERSWVQSPAKAKKSKIYPIVLGWLPWSLWYLPLSISCIGVNAHGNKWSRLHNSHSNSSWKNRMFEECKWFGALRLDPTALPKYLDVNQDREHLKMLNMLIFIKNKWLKMHPKGCQHKKERKKEKDKKKERKKSRKTKMER